MSYRARAVLSRARTPRARPGRSPCVPGRTGTSYRAREVPSRARTPQHVLSRAGRGRQGGSSGKSVRKARRIGPVDGQNVLGRVKIGPGGAAGRAILVRGTTANLPAGQVGPSAVAQNTPSSNRRGRRAKRDPLMDRGRLKRSQSDQEGPRAGGCQGGGGSANLTARGILTFYRPRKCPRVKSQRSTRSEGSVNGASRLGTGENGPGEAEGWRWPAGRG